MKTKSEFILPLSNYAVELLIGQKKFTSDSKYVFPSFRDKNRPLSENTLISALEEWAIKRRVCTS